MKVVESVVMSGPDQIAKKSVRRTCAERESEVKKASQS